MMKLITLRKNLFNFALIAFLLLFYVSNQAWGNEVSLPRLASPVVDNVHLFSDKVIAFVETELYRLRQGGGPQIQVLSIESLDGANIEQYSIKIMDQEKIGDETKDDGLLFIISKSDKKMRIEVGQGLEGSLPDVNAKRIIDDIIKPYFRQGDMNAGLIQGLLAITSQVAPDFKWSQNLGYKHTNKGNRTKTKDISLVIIIIFIYLFISIFSRRRSSHFFGGSGWGGGPFIGGGRGGGGGSWGGGGGGFSGGGASGDW
jgi:uncharacterized protein